MQAETNLEDNPGFFSRYIPLLIWLMAAITGLLIPFKILSIGYTPPDDAGCHVGKAISGKTWPEILVMDERFAPDEHPGWHAILGAMHRWFNLDSNALMVFSVAAPFLSFWLVMLIARRRPEGILPILLAAAILGPLPRLLVGRPFVVMLVCYSLLLYLWTRGKKISVWTSVASIFVFGFSVWVHGSWYLFGIVPVGFALANEWRKAAMLGICWIAGSVLGAAMTGHPYGYLHETFVHLLLTVGGARPSRALVGELQPQPPDGFFVFILLALIWRVARGEWKTGTAWNPLLALTVLGWIMGFKIIRFWTDWGFPAALLCLGAELEGVLQSHWKRGSRRTLVLAGLASAGVYFAETGDVNTRWTSNLGVEYLTPETPGIEGWLPEKGGIVYSDDMVVFFRMFWKNPTADWRYALGFEPAIMTPENYEILSNIQLNRIAANFKPWVDKMRPEDRLIILEDQQPNMPELEWHLAVKDTWIGRLPRTKPTEKPDAK